jgi:hypothetical protein
MTAALPSPVIAHLECAIHCASVGVTRYAIVITDMTASWIARSSRAMTDEWEFAT